MYSIFSGHSSVYIDFINRLFGLSAFLQICKLTTSHYVVIMPAEGMQIL